MRRRRPTLLLGAIASTTAVATLATLGPPSDPAHARPAPRQGSAPEPLTARSGGIQAIRADAVVDGYGVGIHTNFLDTPYRDRDAVGDALADLGVRHVRDDLYLGAPRQYAVINALADRGIGFDLILGRPDGAATAADYVDTVATRLRPGAVESLEGANEWDLFGGGDAWPAEVAAWQQELHDAIQADPATQDLPLIAPALAFRWNYSRLGDLTPFADVANAHMYPGGERPSNQITQITTAVRDEFPTGPLVTTEAGYHNAVAAESSHPGVPEDVAGVYLPRLLLEHLARGEQRMYSYELIDEFADPAGTDPESHFGLLRHDLSEKPAYTAMKNLLGLLADPGPAFEPGSLPLTGSGLPSDLRYLLTQKRDGTWILLLWRDVSLYDTRTDQETPVAPDDVTLRLPTAQRWTVYRPSDQAGPVVTSTDRTVSLSLDGEVTAVQVGTAQVPTGPQDVVATAKRGRVVVTWRPPTDGSPFRSFLVTAGGRTVAAGAAAHRVVVGGLPAGKRVRATVSANNAAGSGPAVRSGVVRVR